MVKLHLFTGFENKPLHITPDMELGHLYEDNNDVDMLFLAAGKCGANIEWVQDNDGFIHFDLWGRPLDLAKNMFTIVNDLVLATDMKVMRYRRG